MPTSPEALINCIIGERLRVVRALGSGGVGSVYEVEHLELGKKFAAKVIRPNTVSESAVKRLVREGQLLAKIKHPNVIAVHSVFADPAAGVVVVLDYAEGRPLSDLIKMSGRLKVGVALRLAVDILKGLEAVHKEGITHRDIKPANVMIVDDNGQPCAVLIDFGLAKQDENVQKLTQTGAFIGTPLYMSPEQCVGKPMDARSDIYSFGCLFYEMLAGRPPFVGDNPVALVNSHLKEKAPSLSDTNPELARTSRLDDIILKAISKEPDNRYQSVSDLLADLEQYRANPVVTGVRRGPARLRKVSTSAMFLAAAIVFGASVLGIKWLLQHTPVHQAPAPQSDRPFEDDVRLEKEATEYATNRNWQKFVDNERMILARHAPSDERTESPINRQRRATAANSAAIGYLQMGKTSEAREMIQKSANLSLLDHDRISASHHFTGMLKLCRVLGNWQAGEVLAQDGERIVGDIVDVDRHYFCSARGIAQLMRGKYVEAEEWFSQAVSAAKRVPVDKDDRLFLQLCPLQNACVSGQYSKGAILFDAMDKDYQNNELSLFYGAICLKNVGDVQRARDLAATCQAKRRAAVGDTAAQSDPFVARLLQEKLIRD